MNNKSNTFILDEKLYEFIPVLEVEEGDIQDTYDITVEKHHAYHARNPDQNIAFVSHNTALISLFDFDDYDMRHCKDGDFSTTNPQRWMANNSAVWPDRELTQIEITEFMLDMMKSGRGEPGIFNRRGVINHLPDRRRSDKNDLIHYGTNPCFSGDTMIAVADGRNAVSIQKLSDIGSTFPVYSAVPVMYGNQSGLSNTFSHWKTEIQIAKAFISGEKEIVEVLLSDGLSFKCTPDHRLATKDGRWVEAQYTEGENLAKFYSYSNKNSKKSYRHINSKTNGFARQYRMIYEFEKGVYDSKNFSIDHINGDSTQDSIENLNLLNNEDHKEKSKLGMIGTNNAVYRVKDKEHHAWARRLASISNNGKRYLWSKERIEEAKSKFLENNPEPIFQDEDVDFSEQVYVKEIIWTGEVEKVYDLTVEKNHNFFILTKTDDDNYLNSSGVLVHNCSEILLRPYQFCNLSSAVARNGDNLENLKNKIELATILGTIQSMATHFPGLRKIWKKNSEEERLLGVDINGQMDCALVREAEVQRTLRDYAIEVNKKYSAILDINQSVHVTVVKPSGNSSVFLNTSSGLHARHSPYYIRNVRVNVNGPIYKVLKSSGVPMDPENGQTLDSATTWVAHFPVQSPDLKYGIFRNDRSALQQLDYWKQVKINYTEGNPSVTITYKPNEIFDVIKWVHDNQEWIAGISFLPNSDAQYDQMPYEEISKEQYDLLNSKFPKINWSKIYRFESEDMTTASQELACTGGSCLVD